MSDHSESPARPVSLFTVVILLGVFAIQRHGTDRVGRMFGPIMLVWFAVLAALGLQTLWPHPIVLSAVDPRHVCAALIAACRTLGVTFCENEANVPLAGPTVIAAGAWASRIPGLEGAPRAFSVKGHLLGYHREKNSLPSIVRHGHHYALQRANGYTIFGSDEQRDVWDTTPKPERVAALRRAGRPAMTLANAMASARPAATNSACELRGQIANSPQQVADANYAATQASINRRETSIAQTTPGLLLA